MKVQPQYITSNISTTETHIESFAKYIFLLQSMTFTMFITLSIILIYYFAPFLVSSFALVFAL